MKIMICGSMHFAKEMLEAQKILRELGHEAGVPCDTHECLTDPDLNMDLEYCIANNVDKKDFNQIAAGDAILVLNYPKNGLHGYIGGAVLMEIGLARHLDKKIFILHDLPNIEEVRYVLEIKLAQPTILGGDIKKIIDHI